MIVSDGRDETANVTHPGTPRTFAQWTAWCSAASRRIRAIATARRELANDLVDAGTFDGERWIMEMVSAPGLPKNHRFREIITDVPEGVRYVEERSVDGGPWEVTEDYRFRRVK